jgi:hypothetical protein
MTNIQSFINTLHIIWMTDALILEEYLDIIWPLMVRYEVKWKEPRELDTDDFLRSVEKGFDTDEFFGDEVNCMAADKFQFFEKTCFRFMDFSKMENKQRRAA